MNLSQRDPKWSSIKLGTSNTTIGGYGCVITCISMQAGLTPPEVNDRLKSVNGFANTNLVIWSKIKEAIPWLEFEWRGYTYDNTRVSEAVKTHKSCLVEVDGTPIGGTKHWVLYIGNQKLIDPWDGKEKPTSSYRAIGYSIIKVGEKPTMMYKGLDLTNQESMKVAVDVWDEVVNKRLYTKVSQDEYGEMVKQATAYQEFRRAGFETPQVVKNIIDDYKKTNESYKRETEAANREAEERRQDFKILIQSLAEILQTRQDPPEIINQTQIAAEKAGLLDDCLSLHKEDKEDWAKREMDFNGEIAKWKAIAEQEATLGDYETAMLIRELIKRFTKALDLGRK